MWSNPQTALPGSFSELFANGIRNTGMEILLGSMLWQDDPQHRRLRSLVSKSFSIKDAELQRPRIRRIAFAFEPVVVMFLTFEVKPAPEAQHIIYLIRLLGFLLLIAGIIDKNRRYGL